MKKMEKIEFSQLQEQLYHEKMDNGLQVYILPKPEFNKTFATFTTNYGSIDNQFVPLNENEMTKVPDGIAHFLEHKLFEKEDGDVFQQFSKQGASANAFTSFTRTAYLFSCTSNFEENLETLVDFVQEPYFSEKTVEKEKALSVKKLQCMTTIRTGACILAPFKICTKTTLLKLILPARSNRFHILIKICCIHAMKRSTIQATCCCSL